MDQMYGRPLRSPVRSNFQYKRSIAGDRKGWNYGGWAVICGPGHGLGAGPCDGEAGDRKGRPYGHIQS